ncbi:MAG: hypothetical protein ABWZ40_06540 [Caulobacterales bacterium]
MARETIYLVQGFTDKGGALKADAPTRCKTKEGAIRNAELLGETKAGAVAFSSSGDAELGDYDDDPVILSVVGRVPESFTQ